VFLDVKGSRGHVCPQLCAGSPVSALCMSFHEARGVTRPTCITLGMKYVSTSASTECGQGSMCVRQTDTGGTESQLSALLGGLGQGSAPTRASLSFICNMGVRMGMRLNSTEPFPAVIFYTRISCDGGNILCYPMWRPLASHGYGALEIRLVGLKNSTFNFISFEQPYVPSDHHTGE